MKGVSLFSGIGMAETYLARNGIEICVANEIVPLRAKTHLHFYPECKMIVGDIQDDEIFNEIYDVALKENCEFLIATPPCQGMSTAGKQLKDDPRNQLIVPTVKMIKKLNPKFVIIENVSQLTQTSILVDGEWVLILDYIERNLRSNYEINERKVVNTVDYEIPQNRERCVCLLARKDQKIEWEFPEPSSHIVTLREAIGNLPSVDPYIIDATPEERNSIFPDYEKKKEAALAVSKWHYPPRHFMRHVIPMIHTAEGHSAMENKIFYPKVKSGEKSKGFNNTYKRQWWDKPAYTITQYNNRIGSQENGHPGHAIMDSEDEEMRRWSDPRIFTVYELMIVSSLPTDWDIPEWASANFFREVIGEGVPPRLIEVAIIELKNNLRRKDNEE